MPVPLHVFEKDALDANFVIPANKTLRIELRGRLESYARYGIMFDAKHANVRRMVLARLAAIEAFDSALS